ncbi:MAG: hypothetical protein A4E49_00997 [Methanosaeta sp. PtaU1.Bin112]|nr:MAG: hypothetical protein A4E49_00997 [Methanosaeta sp. PtaU1.Bin112]
MNISEAVKPHPLGCTISFEVVPESSRLAVPSGYNLWRRSIEAHLTEEPSRGRANRQLTGELARVLGISEGEIFVLCGQKSARKLLLVKGMAPEQVVLAMMQRLG